MKNLTEKIQKQFDKMCATGKLFRVDLSGNDIWDLYMKGFGKDPVFRDPESSYHNCNLCNNFIRRYGNVVAITDDLKIISMFDVDTTEEYQGSMDLMSKTIVKAPIVNVFFETFDELNSLPYEKVKKNQDTFKLGVDVNHKRYTKEEAEKFGVVKPNEVKRFHHFTLQLPTQYLDKSGNSIEYIMGHHRDMKNVFQRAMEEIPLSTLELVRDLINQGSLLNGEAHLFKVEAMIPLKQEYDKVELSKRDNWCWEKSRGLAIAKFKNELIGVLCSEIAEGEELNKACQAWNKRVDPANYMKAVAPITETQKKEAQKFVEENGYVESFDRRHATLDDIKATEIKHINVGDGKIEEVSIFDKVQTKKSAHKRSQFDNVEEVPVEKFLETILPNCTSVEAFVENRHEGNFVNLTTSKHEESKNIFKWNNSYSWTYKGNLTGKSQIKEAVKMAGGNVEGVLNFRLAWNDGDGTDRSDLDAWAQEPDGTQIGFSTGYRKDQGGGRTNMSGQLDVDNTDPFDKMGVENITWTNKSRMKNGVYKLWVHQYSARNSQGFKAEIEFDGETFEYSYDRPVRGNVVVAEVTVKDGVLSIEHKLPSKNSTKEIYGLETNNFHKVNLVCLSPNHWGDNNTGNKHYFFMLDKCKADGNLRSFHSENLKPDVAKHRKVLEVLGAVNMLEPSEKQLAGLGFNATVKDEVILKLGGNFKRTIKVKF